MDIQQALKLARRADRVLESNFQYYSQPDRVQRAHKFRRMKHWMKLRNKAETKLWKVIED